MRHLTDVEHVDLLDGALAPSRASHVEECEVCRAASERMREVLARMSEAAIPEPSPLFWEHFSARVHEDVRDAETSAASGWWGWTDSATVRWAMSGALLTVLLVAAVWKASAPGSDVRAPLTTASTAAGSVADDVDLLDAIDPDTEEAWALVRTIADDVLLDDSSWDDAATEGLGVRPGSAERAMGTLTGPERSELVRLLEAETKQPGV
jgi:hypothetical protein